MRDDGRCAYIFGLFAIELGDRGLVRWHPKGSAQSLKGGLESGRHGVLREVKLTFGWKDMRMNDQDQEGRVADAD